MQRVIVIGMGPIGVCCARAVAAERDMRLVGMIDIDPTKIGSTLAQLDSSPPRASDPADAADARRHHDHAPDHAGDNPRAPRVTDTLTSALDHAGGADAAIVTTSSQFNVVAGTIDELLDHGIATVSSCEQMAWPWYRHAALADQIDAHAHAAGKAVLGTGVNPGFVMDTLAVVLSTMLRRVTAVRCVRRVDAATRRPPLQAKVGATMVPAQFNELAKKGTIGHAGIGESVALLAAGLGRSVMPGTVKESMQPVIAKAALESALGLIEPGQVCGMHNTASWADDGLSIELDLTMAIGLENPIDTIALDGPVRLQLQIPGSTPGDSATVAALINTARALPDAAPGLRSMLDFPIAGCRGRDR